MVRMGVRRGRKARPDGDRIVGPETAAEKAEEKIFEEAVREDRIVDGVRTRIDRRK